MNRFENLKEKGKAFVPFVVLGDPDFDTSFEVIKKLIDSGADALELGLNFSDPIADGSTIQEADLRAAEAGMDTNKDFELIKKIRAYNSEIPISLLIYYNLILQRGIEKFYVDAKAVGVDAVLAADCPVEEAEPLLKAAKKSGISQVFIVAPTTTNARLKKILSVASGYVYLVGLLGVTGARQDLQGTTLELIKRVKPLTNLPVFMGFGISSAGHVKQVLEAGADGVIVGSAIINLMKENLGDRHRMLEAIGKFALELKNAAK